MRIEGEGMRISNKKKERSDKKHRIQALVDQKTYTKFSRLARACNISESQLSAEMIRYLTNAPNYVNWIQDKYNVNKEDPFRLTPIVENGEVNY